MKKYKRQICSIYALLSSIYGLLLQVTTMLPTVPARLKSREPARCRTAPRTATAPPSAMQRPSQSRPTVDCQGVAVEQVFTGIPGSLASDSMGVAFDDSVKQMFRASVSVCSLSVRWEGIAAPSFLDTGFAAQVYISNLDAVGKGRSDHDCHLRGRACEVWLTWSTCRPSPRTRGALRGG